MFFPCSLISPSVKPPKTSRMKKKYFLKKLPLLVLLLCITSNLFSQTKSIEDLKSETYAKITLNQDLGVPNFIKFPVNQPLRLNGVTLQQKVQTFLSSYKSIYGITNISEQLIYESTKVDLNNFSRVMYKQAKNDVPVYDGKMYFHFNSNNELTATTIFLPSLLE